MDPIRAIAVVAAVIEREGKILITRRPPGSHLAGFWEFPGGKAMPGEADREALARELREELGVAAIVGEPVEIVEWHYPDKHVRIEFFRCDIQGRASLAGGSGDGVGGAGRARPLRVSARGRGAARPPQAAVTAERSPRRLQAPQPRTAA